MRRIQEDIDSRSFRPVYLLYGQEDYLKHQFRDKLIDAILPPGDTMNLTRFPGDVTSRQVMEAAESVPFFMAERRLIVCDKTGFFKKSPEGFSDFLKNIPPTAILIFTETDTDGRCASFQAAKKAGLAVDFSHPDMETLSRWIVSCLKKEGMSITGEALSLFIGSGSADMEAMHSELEKLICYCLGRTAIEKEDVAAVCLPDNSANIWRMIDAFAEHNGPAAYAEYQKLLMAREAPLMILSLMERHVRLIYSAADLDSRGIPLQQIASQLSVRDFAVKNYLRQSRAFSRQQLFDMLTAMAEAEESCKSGRLKEQAAVEIIISRYTTPG